MAHDISIEPVIPALHSCVSVLRRMANYELEPSLKQRMHELGERKEFLSAAEHDELLALVEFSENRTEEKLEAMTALRDLQEAVPTLTDQP